MGNLSNDPRGVIGLEASFDEGEVFDQLLKVFSIDFALDLCAARRLK